MADPMTTPLTVEYLRQFARPTGADFVVLVAYFDTPGHTQYLTWGREADDKVAASDLAEEISRWINSGGCKSMNPATGPETVLESFKLDAAKNKAEVDRLRDDLAWIRRKLKLAEDTPMFTGGGPTIAGALHVLDSHAHGYTAYIKAHKCDDKEGEIARQSVEIERLKRMLKRQSALAQVAECRGMVQTLEMLAPDDLNPADVASWRHNLAEARGKLAELEAMVPPDEPPAA